MDKGGRPSVLRTAVSFALTYLLVWGGVPAPSLAETRESDSPITAVEDNRENANEASLAEEGLVADGANLSNDSLLTTQGDDSLVLVEGADEEATELTDNEEPSLTLSTLSSSSIALTSGGLASVNKQLSSGDSFTATFSVPEACFGYAQIVGKDLHAVLKKSGKVIDEWDPWYTTANTGLNGPLALEAGAYELVVTRKQGVSGTVTLERIGFTSNSVPTTGDPMAIESEPNGTIETADTLSVGTRMFGSICQGGASLSVIDKDVYQIRLTKKSGLKITTSAQCYDRSTVLGVWDSSGNLVRRDGLALMWGGFNKVDLTSEVLDCGELDAGTYYVYLESMPLLMDSSGNGVSTTALSKQVYSLEATLYDSSASTNPPSTDQPTDVDANPVTDDNCALLRKDGTAWRCSARGVATSSVWDYDDKKLVRTLYVEADVTTFPEDIIVNWGGGSSSFGAWLQFKNMNTVVFLTDSSGKNACTVLDEDAFDNCSKLETIVGLESTRLKTVRKYAFSRCEALTSIVLPESVTSIGEHAFAYCPMLESITIRSKAATIGDSAFYNSNAIKGLYLHVTNCNVFDNYAFFGSPFDDEANSDAVIYVPYSAMDAYKAYGKKRYLDGWPERLRVLLGESPVKSSNGKGVKPEGFLDSCSDSTDGTIRVKGWAHDSDSSNKPVTIRVYVGGRVGSGAKCYTVASNGSSLKASKSRSDIGASCGFDYKVKISERGVQNVYVYAVDNETGDTVLLSGAPKRVTISGVLIGRSTVSVANQVYSGKALTPKPTVKLGSKVLVASTDYTVAYKNNVNAGTATVTVTGKGYYSGTKSATFKIAAVSISGASVSVASQTYDGYTKKPRVTVKVNGKTLSKNRDFTASYKNNVNVGTATVIVKGKGNYAGKASASFSIVKAKNTMKAKALKKTISLDKLKKKGFTVACPMKLTKARGKVSFKKIDGSKRLTVNASTGKVTVKRKTKKGEYAIKIEVTATGNASYKPITKVVTCKIVVK